MEDYIYTAFSEKREVLGGANTPAEMRKLSLGFLEMVEKFLIWQNTKTKKNVLVYGKGPTNDDGIQDKTPVCDTEDVERPEQAGV